MSPIRRNLLRNAFRRPNAVKRRAQIAQEGRSVGTEGPGIPRKPLAATRRVVGEALQSHFGRPSGSLRAPSVPPQQRGEGGHLMRR